MKQKKEKNVDMKKKVKEEVSKQGYNEASLDDLDAVSGGRAGGGCPGDPSCSYDCMSCSPGNING